MNRSRGVTLIELLIAIVISAIVASLAYASLDASRRATERGSANINEINNVESLFQALQADFDHIVDRRLPDAVTSTTIGRGSPPFSGGEILAQEVIDMPGAYVLRMVRDGWSNPLQQQRSDLQRVAYRLDEDGRLWRDYWSERNQPLEELPLGQRLLTEGVDEFRIRFLPAAPTDFTEGAWQLSWPASDTQVQNNVRRNVFPAAVEVTLSTESLGEIQRLFVLAAL